MFSFPDALFKYSGTPYNNGKATKALFSSPKI